MKFGEIVLFSTEIAMKIFQHEMTALYGIWQLPDLRQQEQLLGN